MVFVFGWIWFGVRGRRTSFKIHGSRLITLILCLECVHNVIAMIHMFESFNQILIHYSIIRKREFEAFLFSRLFFTLAVLTKFFWLVRTCVDIQMVPIKWKLLQYIINRFIPLAPYPLLILLIIMNVELQTSRSFRITNK